MIQDILAALGVVINGLPQGFLALSFGFSAVPTALAFIIGAIGCGAFGLVAPISFQAETITLAGTLGDDFRDRISMIFVGGAIMALIGAFGFLQTIINFIGPVITKGMMAGVGIMLTWVAVDMSKQDRPVGFSSIAVALFTYVLTQDLVYTIVSSVIVGSIVGMGIEKEEPVEFDTDESFKLRKLTLNPMVIRGALAMVCLNIGANIAFGKITGSIAGSSVNIDHLAVVSSLADMGSALFGGAPVESIISATGAAPHPVFSGVIMMGIMAAILLAGLLPKIGRYVPAESISGFLLVLGMLVTVPQNAETAMQDPLVGGVTMTVTAVTDPFIGMVSGLAVKFLAANFGL